MEEILKKYTTKMVSNIAIMNKKFINMNLYYEEIKRKLKDLIDETPPELWDKMKKSDPRDWPDQCGQEDSNCEFCKLCRVDDLVEAWKEISMLGPEINIHWTEIIKNKKSYFFSRPKIEIILCDIFITLLLIDPRQSFSDDGFRTLIEEEWAPQQWYEFHLWLADLYHKIKKLQPENKA